MNHVNELAALLLLAAAAPPLLQAQQVVGYPPDQSPYHDVETPQRITLFGGYGPHREGRHRRRAA